MKIFYPANSLLFLSTQPPTVLAQQTNKEREEEANSNLLKVN